MRARPDARVLDVGSGTGFYVALWRELGVRPVTGSDITAKAVGKLRAAFPDDEFVRFDVGGEELPLPESSFDLISAFDVLFHVTDDARFRRALHNLSTLLPPRYAPDASAVREPYDRDGAVSPPSVN